MYNSILYNFKIESNKLDTIKKIIESNNNISNFILFYLKNNKIPKDNVLCCNKTLNTYFYMDEACLMFFIIISLIEFIIILYYII